MKEVLYIDTYFFINFVMDFISVLITSMIVSEKIKGLRAALSAACGAFLSALLVYFSVKTVWNTVFSILFLPLLLLIAFGRKKGKKFVFICLFFLITNFFLGGVVNAIYYYSGFWEAKHRLTLSIFLIVSLAGFTAWTLWGKGLKRKLDTTVVSLSILFGEKSCELYALVDSGCLLKEPISKMPVILMKGEYADSILSAEHMEALKNGSPAGELKIYAVPIRTASGSRLMFGFRPKKVRLHNKAYRKQYKETDAVIVAVDFSEGGFGGCPCLVPLSIV